MKFFAIFAVLALSAVASASPVDSVAISKRAGPSGESPWLFFAKLSTDLDPSGKVIKPSGGTSVDQGAGIQM